MLRKIPAARPLLAFLAFLTLALSWSLGTPLLSAADEPEQAVRAMAVVRGEFSGAQQVWNFAHWQSTYTTPDYLETRYRLPHDLVRAVAAHDPACYAFNEANTAACTVTSNTHRIAQAGATALSHMNYSPLYYALVGWPSLLLRGDNALYAMRVVSALITALLLAAAFTTSARRGRAAAVGVVAAATPAAIYFGAVVNPSGLEIASALLAWASLISMTRAESAGGTRLSDRILFTVAAATLLLVRPLGPVWLGIIVLAVFAASPDPRARLRAAVRGRGARWMFAALAAALAATLAWDATQNTLGILPRPNATYTFAKGASMTLAQTPQFFAQMVGLIGWNDVHVPTATTYLWYGTVVALLLAGLIVGGRRERLVLLALAVIVVAFPIAFEGYSGASYGVGWQGRYSLPFAVGVPLLAAEVLGRRLWTAEPGGIPRALAKTVGAVLALGYLCEVWWAWRRYAEGLGSASHYLPTHAKWTPLISWPGMIGLAVLGVAGVFALLASSSTFRVAAAAEAAEQDGDAPEPPAQAPAGSPGVESLVNKL
ncbi:DUF2142 domain-containing protein [Actinospica sp. MGRD01-02]|uniref:DUF2142 domain-containing protein n=1 Tax=Actinospica acidithermotolerans TaxID=2828514 RepID=A0A941EBN1_9ACTN|nr:DUF2142 domain-containing protein [Actinospica acidithermotolerans]MBR7826074.1 DUF2142 domain-containing protein [Actinospica acidithermotolerans]